MDRTARTDLMQCPQYQAIRHLLLMGGGNLLDLLLLTVWHPFVIDTATSSVCFLSPAVLVKIVPVMKCAQNPSMQILNAREVADEIPVSSI